MPPATGIGLRGAPAFRPVAAVVIVVFGGVGWGLVVVVWNDSVEGVIDGIGGGRDEVVVSGGVGPVDGAVGESGCLPAGVVFNKS